jgi:hypothetical protein
MRATMIRLMSIISIIYLSLSGTLFAATPKAEKEKAPGFTPQELSKPASGKLTIEQKTQLQALIDKQSKK